MVEFRRQASPRKNGQLSSSTSCTLLLQPKRLVVLSAEPFEPSVTVARSSLRSTRRMGSLVFREQARFGHVSCIGVAIRAVVGGFVMRFAVVVAEIQSEDLQTGKVSPSCASSETERKGRTIKSFASAKSAPPRKGACPKKCLRAAEPSGGVIARMLCALAGQREQYRWGRADAQRALSSSVR